MAEPRPDPRPTRSDAPEPRAALRDLQGRYDALLCDIWGVVHDGVQAFAPAVAALRAFRSAGGRVVLLSNVPKPRGPIPGQLDRIGVPRDAWDAIVTSGDATRAALAARAPGPAYLIGTGDDAPLWEGLGLTFAPLERAEFLCVTGLADFAHGAPEEHRAELLAARARGLELVCANPDIVVRHGGRLHWCAGALARDYAALGGRVVLCGKPHAPIYALAFSELAQVAGRPVDRARVLAIGDGPGTDVLGANRAGVDALFVASGIQGDDLRGGGGLDLEGARRTLEEAGATARWVMADLR